MLKEKDFIITINVTLKLDFDFDDDWLFCVTFDFFPFLLSSFNSFDSADFSCIIGIKLETLVDVESILSKLKKSKWIILIKINWSNL